MAYPSTTILPPSPSRISDPVNFVNESALYLQNLPNFRTQFNALTAYINTKYPNYNNYGTVVDSNPVMPTVATFAAGVSGTGVAYISSVDTFYENLYTNSSRANSYGAWIDSVMTITGTGSTDTTRAQVPAISAAATRSQTRTAFNTSSILFTETAIKSVRELASAFNYINTNAFGSFDNGLVTAAIDATDDYGRFKATYLDGTKNLDGTYTLSVTQTTNDIVLQDSVTSLFAGGLEGVAYDFNDLSTLFQDHEGRTPVTAAGQPVGLVLDKSKKSVFDQRINFLSYSNTITNAAWAKVGGITVLDNQAVAPDSTITAASVVGDTTANNGVYQVISKPIPAGTIVTRSVYLRSVSGTQTVTLVDPAFTDGVVVCNLTTNWQRFSLTEAASSYGCGLWVRDIKAAGIYIWGAQVEVGSSPSTVQQTTQWPTSWLGNHAYQTTPASRPLLQRNATTGAYYLAFDGIDDFLVTNPIDFTATDKISLFTGLRKLSDATIQVILAYGKNTSVAGSFNLFRGGLASQHYVTEVRGGTNITSLVASSAEHAAPVSSVISEKLDLSGAVKLGLRVNSIQVGSSIADLGGGNFSKHPLYIGRYEGTSLPFNGHIYALVIVGKFASDGEIYETETILADRVGILV